MRLVHLSPRVAPFYARTAEALVAAELPPVLGEQGHGMTTISVAPAADPERVMPNQGIARRLTPLQVQTPHGDLPIHVLEGMAEGGTGRLYLLGLPDGPSATRDLFARSALALMQTLTERPDVVHLHGETGMDVEALREQLPGPAVVCSVYDVRSDDPVTAAALEEADAVIVPFSDYARGGSEGSEAPSVTRALTRRAMVRVVPHGIDVNRWDPLHDPVLPTTFGTHKMEGKVGCRRALQQLSGLAPRSDMPIVAVWSMSGPDSGVPVVAELGDALRELDVQLVAIGSPGDMGWAPSEAATGSPLHVFSAPAEDERLLRLVLSGSDVVLLPDLGPALGYEALIAQRYGVVPVARRVQAHRDVLVEYDALSSTGGAFLFDDAGELHQALRRMRLHFQDQLVWSGLAAANTAVDSSWGRTAALVGEIYRKATAK